jgi:hypothetical protein
MTTAANIITLSLKDIGVLDENETPSSALMSDCLATLNQMLALWSLENVYIYAKQTISFPVTGAQSYTIGSGGNILWYINNTSGDTDVGSYFHYAIPGF